ncbi:MAG TPA: FixH family protein [Ktedonobacteraceae bacterium]|nr:FixH family protein [Ktedonobacteraceae bacterium]
MRKKISRTTVRRGLLVLTVGIILLFLTLAVNAVLAKRTASGQPATPTMTGQAGPYTVALYITPNPPSTLQFARLTLRVTDTASGQPVTDAGVQIQGVMESMGMGLGPVYANPQQDGSYAAQVKLSMQGFWQVQVIVTRLNTPPASVRFEIAASAPPA